MVVPLRTRLLYPLHNELARTRERAEGITPIYVQLKKMLY